MVFQGLSFSYKFHNPYVVAATATMGGLLFGFDISSMSGFIGSTAFKDFFGTAGGLSAVKQAGITSCMSAGSFLGSICSGSISDKFGRRFTIQLSSIVWCIGAAVQSSSQNIGQLVAGRVIAGFGIGLASSQVPVYIAELSPKNIRGRLVGMYQWSVTWGIMIMFYIAFGCGKISGTGSFRLAWGLQIVPGLCLFFGTGFLEDSPRWLASKNRWEEALAIIHRVQAQGSNAEENVLIEIEEIKEAVRIQHESQAGIVEMFRGATNIRRTLIGLWCQIWQQLTGMNVMMYYVVNVFTMAGYDGDANLVASSIQYVINVIMTVPALLFIDRWGRRPVFIFGAILMMGWLFAMAGILATYSIPTGPEGFEGNTQVRIRIPTSNKAASHAAIAVSYLFVATFAPTWGPAGWIYCSEIFPLEQRATGNGLTAAANWIFNFAIALFTPIAFVNITWKTYLIYACSCFAMTIHVFLMFPETHGRTLEEIDMMFKANVPAWKSHKWQPEFLPNIADINAAGGGGAPEYVAKRQTEHLENADEISDVSVEAKASA